MNQHLNFVLYRSDCPKNEIFFLNSILHFTSTMSMSQNLKYSKSWKNKLLSVAGNPRETSTYLLALQCNVTKNATKKNLQFAVHMLFLKMMFSIFVQTRQTTSAECSIVLWNNKHQNVGFYRFFQISFIENLT
jgi:hypothetical protein